MQHLQRPCIVLAVEHYGVHGETLIMEYRLGGDLWDLWALGVEICHSEFSGREEHDIFEKVRKFATRACHAPSCSERKHAVLHLFDDMSRCLVF